MREELLLSSYYVHIMMSSMKSRNEKRGDSHETMYLHMYFVYMYIYSSLYREWINRVWLAILLEVSPFALEILGSPEGLSSLVPR